MLLVRSLLFHIAFYLFTALCVLACMLSLPFQRRAVIRIAQFWGRITPKIFTFIVGGSYEVRGLENLPEGKSLIIASKHMSVFETFALIPLVHDPLFILKRELMWIPFFGWAVAKGDMIPIDRGSRTQALKQILERGWQKMSETPRQLIIFPEGTRRLVDVEPRYKYGISHLYKALDVPCVPVALNTGLFWPRQSFCVYPGKIIIEFLPMIEPSLAQDKFFELMSTTVESHSDRLIEEARTDNPSLRKTEKN